MGGGLRFLGFGQPFGLGRGRSIVMAGEPHKFTDISSGSRSLQMLAFGPSIYIFSHAALATLQDRRCASGGAVGYGDELRRLGAKYEESSRYHNFGPVMQS